MSLNYRHLSSARPSRASRALPRRGVSEAPSAAASVRRPGSTQRPWSTAALGWALLLAPWLTGQLRPLLAQQAPAVILDRTGDLAASGALGQYDLSSTDMTFKAARNEVWVLDAYGPGAPIINTFGAENLQGARAQISITLPADLVDAPVLGIAEIPHGDLQGMNLVLVDPTFGSSSAPDPRIGVYDDDGQLIAGQAFVPVAGLDGSTRLTSLAVSPEREEILSYDVDNHRLVLMDFFFSLLKEPINLLGFQSGLTNSWFIGTVDRNGLRGGGLGIAFHGPDAAFVVSSFENAFDTRFALEYDLTGSGAYTGRAMDLSGVKTGNVGLDTIFTGIATGRRGQEDALYGVNAGNDALYAFALETSDQSTPALLLSCSIDPATLSYNLEWALPPGADPDAIRIVENGVLVATLPPDTTTFTSSWPVFGKMFLGVLTEKDGLVTEVFEVCQVENGERPPFRPDFNTDATQITSLGTSLYGVAVTKTPASVSDFRAYVLGQGSNAVQVLDNELNLIETLQPTPAVTTQGSNLAAVGVALLKIDGEDHLAILDSDGPQNDNVPSATIHSLSPQNRGELVLSINPIDLSQLAATPFLLDWDADADNNIVAGGQMPNLDYVIVKLVFDGQSIVATDMAPVPQRMLTPYESLPISGIGVSILPSGNLLVAGSDTFSSTYTEALLTTPFTDDPLTSVKFVGYAQGLLVANQFFGFGPDIGPSFLTGLDAAYFPPVDAEPGFGVTYLPTGNVLLIQGRLQTRGLLFVHSTTEVADPNLVTQQLTDEAIDLPPGARQSTLAIAPSFRNTGDVGTFFVYVLNPSETAPLPVDLEVELGGQVVDTISSSLTIAAGRYFRTVITGDPLSSLKVSLTSRATAAVKARVLLGAAATGTLAPLEPTFIRGDCNGNGSYQITDAIVGLDWLFKGGTQPACVDSCDTDDNGRVNLTDMVALLNHLFQGGPPPLPPSVATGCGQDPTADDLAACEYDPLNCE